MTTDEYRELIVFLASHAGLDRRVKRLEDS